MESYLNSLRRCALRTRGPGHDPWTIRRPRRHSRYLFVAGAIADPRRIFRRRHRVATRIRYRYSNVAAQSARRSTSCSARLTTSAAVVRDYIAKDHLRIAIEPEENDEAEIRMSEGWIEAGSRRFQRAHFRIARSENSRSAISCWPRQSARNFQQAKGMARSRRAHRHLFPD